MAFTALYDACVLYPAPLRDLLVRLAVTGLFRAKWSNDIHEEWIRNVLANRPDLTLAQLSRARELMDRSVPDCLVERYQSFVDSLTLPDLDDRHVLAAAIQGRADVIVTFNLKDFPRSILNEYNVEAQHPDTFIMNLLDLDTAAVNTVVKEQRELLRKPPQTADELLSTFKKLGLAQVANELSHYKALL